VNFDVRSEDGGGTPRRSLSLHPCPLNDCLRALKSAGRSRRSLPLLRSPSRLTLPCARYPPDFEKGFIKAEVIWWEDYAALDSEAKCREAGKLGIEGKDYVMHDGDVVHFRFNV